MSSGNHAYDKSSDKIDVEQKETIEQDSSSTDQLSFTEHEENELVRKLDRRILPILYIVYLFAC